MGRQINFFATKEDLVNAFNIISNERKIIFVKGVTFGNEKAEYSVITDIPHLGVSISAEHCSERYLIVDLEKNITYENMILQDGKTKRFAHNSMNDGSVSFFAGGIYEPQNCLIHGQISTVFSEKDKLDLFNCIGKILKKQFKNYHGWYIGDEAYKLYGTMRFITISANSPKEYDLKLEK